MKPGDLRAMTVDQLDDEAMKLKKEQFNLPISSSERAGHSSSCGPGSAA